MQFVQQILVMRSSILLVLVKVMMSRILLVPSAVLDWSQMMLVTRFTLIL